MKNLILVFLTFLIISVNVFPQAIRQSFSVEEGWQGISPVKSNREEVEKVLGLPKQGKGYNFRYETADVYMEFVFAAPQICSNNTVGNWNVPHNTVLFYTLASQKGLLVSDLIFDKNKFQRLTSSKHSIGASFEYYSSEDGISIMGELEQNGQEKVNVIVYFIGKKYNSLRCK